ncbi:MAG: endonuclease III [Muribaculaceae bacterium]|nr:endonuclease III [Muribaculaceae bacterium]
MTIKERYHGVLSYFEAAMPQVTTELTYSSEFQLLVAVVLSAQCTDKRVNMVTPALFEAYPTPGAMAKASKEDLLRYMGSVSYPNSKARHLCQLSAMLVEEFGGEVPRTMDELTRLPGVGRKTANVMLAVAFGKSAIAVDTHVFRVSNRLGLASGKTPLDVEKALTKHIPTEKRASAHHWILLHGRYVCKAQRPDCLNCGISRWCKSYGKL